MSLICKYFTSTKHHSCDLSGKKMKSVIIIAVLVCCAYATSYDPQNPCRNNPCKHGGHCIPRDGGYKCRCEHGYHGDNCEKDRCSSEPCKNGGTCTLTDDGYKCQCKPDFCGRHCEDHNQCHPNPCKHGGRCEREGREGYKCHCEKGYFGRHCESDRNY